MAALGSGNNLLQLVPKQILKQSSGGSVVLIASLTNLPYQSTGVQNVGVEQIQGGILMLSKALAVELVKHNIRVNTISPGFVDSDMTRNVRAAKSKREGDQMWLPAPLWRLSTQNDLTAAIVFLLSDALRPTRTADIQITGGLHAGTIDGVTRNEEYF